MKRLFIGYLAVTISITVLAQTEIVIGRKDTLYSSVLNENREIWVSVPSDFRKDLEGQRFPVVFVLDGSAHFYSVVGMVDQFSNTMANEICPPMIVVGLENTNRNRDFYPEFEADKFSVFLKEELLPYIDKKYPAQPYRIIIGHSLAGLRVIKTAIYDKGMFNGYIAIDPSLGDQKNKWYDEARSKITNFDLKDDRMFVAMAQTMTYKRNQVQDTASIKRDTTSDSNHMRRIMEFSETLSRKNTKDRSNYHWKFYPGETHQSLTHIAIYDGIEFIFDWHRPRFWNEFFYEDTSPEKAIELYDNYYKTVSKQLGYEVTSPFDNSMLIWYLEYKKQYEKALAVAKYNIKIHPESENPKEWVKKLEETIQNQ
jgi:predicted alpha/beta superfamily hydrolase